MSRFGEWFREEMSKVVPPLLFFLVAFNILAVTKALFLLEHDMQAVGFLGATIAALIVAKVVVIVDLIPFVNRFPDRPLIYNTLWKTSLYVVAAFVVRILEQLVHHVHGGLSLGGAWNEMGESIVWPHFFAVMLWLSLLLLIYVSLRELTRSIGREQVKKMFFGPLESKSAGGYQ